MKRRCVDYVKSCEACQNWSQSKPIVSKLSCVSAKKVWDHICIDLIGPLPRSKHEFVYIWVCVDVLSRFVILKALINKSAIESAIALCDVITIFGVPKIVQSDQGSEFVNDVLKHLKEKIGFDHRFTTPYLSFQNGLVERHVQTVSNSLRKLTFNLVDSLENWHQVLGAIQFSINCRFTTIHNIQPFFLMFGRDPNLFDDFSNQNPSIAPGEDDKLVKEMVVRWTNIYENVYPKIRAKMKSNQSKMMNNYNSKLFISKEAKGQEFKVGDQVRYKNIQKKSKWEPEFLGPYLIKSINKRTGNYTLCEVGDKEAIVANNIPSIWLRKTMEKVK